MKSKKININRPTISSDEINSFKNFNSIINQVKSTKPIYKETWFLSTLGVTIIAASILMIVILNQTHCVTVNNKTKTQAIKFINPPIPQANIPYLSIKIRNNIDTVIQLQSGTTIKIPSGSIQSQTRKAITETIELRIREFNEPASVFLSGIPMQYDSASRKYTFETAGMIDIAAYKNNERLCINPQTPITLNIVSQNNSPEFNAYYLDTTKKHWQYKGKPSINKNGNTTTTNNQRNEKVKQQYNNVVPLIAPVLPQKANPLKWNIKVDVLQNEFPEFVSYKDVLFEVDKPLGKDDNVFGKTEWENIIIEKTNTTGLYSLLFSKGTQQIKYFVRPVFEGKAYTIAKAKYDTAFAKYKIALKTRLENEAKIKQTYESEIAEQENLYNNTVNRNIIQDKIIRTFKIQNFGIWNCDRVFSYSSERKKINANFEINGVQTNNSVYFVDKKINAVITMYPNSVLYHNPNSKEILWAITDDFKIAIFNSEQFKSIPNELDKYTFNLKELTVKIDRPEDFINLYNNGFK